MNEQRVTQITPAEEDPVVHRYLSALQQHAPGTGFEDRVMARVRRPAPRWVRHLQSVRHAVFNRETRWVWAGGLAASSAFSIVAFATIAMANWVQIETAWSVFTGSFLLEAWRASVHAAAAFAAHALTWTEPITGSEKSLIMATGVTAVVMTMSSWGLFRTMRRYSIERVALHASH